MNDLNRASEGTVTLKLLDAKGKTVQTQAEDIHIEAFGKQLKPCHLTLPARPGAYLLVAEYRTAGTDRPVLSRRYLKVGDGGLTYKDFYDLSPDAP